MYLLLLTLLNSLVVTTEPQKTQATCLIKLGVISTTDRDDGHWVGLVKTAWAELSRIKGIVDMEMEFTHYFRHAELTIDQLIEAYMEMGSKNFSASIGPYVPALVTASEKFGTPYFITTPTIHGLYSPPNVIAVQPDPMDIVRVASEIVTRYNWMNVAVLYDSEDGGRLIESLVLLNKLRVRSWKIHYNATRNEIIEIMLAVRQISIPNIIVHATRNVTIAVLKVALHLSMLSKEFCWLVPSLDLDTQDLEAFAYTQVNFTTLKLVQRSVSGVSLIEGGFTEYDYALVFDSLLTLTEGIRINNRGSRRRSCQWMGNDIPRVIPMIKDTGATGKLAFRADGTRDGYVFDILGLGYPNQIKLGFWNSSEDMNKLYLNETIQKPSILDMDVVTQSTGFSFYDDILKIGIITKHPFAMLKMQHHNYHGNDRFEGFYIDLLYQLSLILGFRYELYLVPGNKIGNPARNGNWDGAVGQLTQGNASLVIGPIMITSSLAKVVEFTKPVRMIGLSAIIRRPTQSVSLFFFLDPLSPLLWVILVFILILLSVTLYVVDRISPTDIQTTTAGHIASTGHVTSTASQGGSEDELESSSHQIQHSPRPKMLRLPAHKCIIFTCSSMVLRASDISPRTLSGRILAGALWFFSLVMISAYTANFAALLTTTKSNIPVRSISDLASQTTMHYGTVKESHISAFLKNSRVDPFQKLWQTMDARQGMMFNTTAEAFTRLEEDTNFAFLWDASELRLKVNQDCDLLELSNSVYFKSYGIALPQGATYRITLNTAILQLFETGRMQLLESRWWPENLCPDPENPVFTYNSLSLDRVAGLFILLALVIFLALALSIGEYYFRAKHKKRKQPQQTSPQQKYRSTSFTSSWKSRGEEVPVSNQASRASVLNEKSTDESLLAKPLCDGMSKEETPVDEVLFNRPTSMVQPLFTTIPTEEPLFTPPTPLQTPPANRSKHTNIF